MNARLRLQFIHANLFKPRKNEIYLAHSIFYNGESYSKVIVRISNKSIYLKIETVKKNTFLTMCEIQPLVFDNLLNYIILLEY